MLTKLHGENHFELQERIEFVMSTYEKTKDGNYRNTQGLSLGELTEGGD